MKQFNLLKEIIVVKKSELLKAINSNQEFGISHKGELISLPTDERHIYIFKGRPTIPTPSTLLATPKPASLETMFGNNYKIVEDDDRVLIKAGGNWQELIKINVASADYDDTTGDGVAEFTDKIMENIGWHATEFDIKYRELVEQLEKNVEGTLFCIENEEPYQFSGMGFINDLEKTRDFLFHYCRDIAQEKIKNDPLFAAEKLIDDEEEAAKFFQVL